MKRLFLSLAAASLAFVALAQDPDGAAAARARINAERSQVEDAFRAQEKACYGKFAVNDCLNEARASRRERLADLRRQEISLNDADRKRKGVERQRSLEERAAREKPAPGDGRPAKDAAGERAKEARERAARSAQKAADRAEVEAGSAARARERQQQAQLRKEAKSAERVRKAEEAARNVKRREQELAKAGERRASLNKRLAGRKKPPAQPLPPPPP